MQIIVSLIFISAFILLLVGWKSPKISLFWFKDKNKQTIRNSNLFYITVLLVCFLMNHLIRDLSEKSETISEQQNKEYTNDEKIKINKEAFKIMEKAFHRMEVYGMNVSNKDSLIKVYKNEFSKNPLKGLEYANEIKTSVDNLISKYENNLKEYQQTQALSNWKYSQSKDEMTNEIIEYARCSSTNNLEFDFPYNGGANSIIEIKRNNNKNKLFLKISKGQFIPSYGGDEYIRVAFDDLKIENYLYSSPRDGNSNYIIIHY